ncbi:Peptidoglycan/xylan/chitin deacetylase, PgdA/CDA1 family [Flavobacterium fluvii]|uniref:Peptidoglycan/xylan/chitin deacetylase, PgdA/CDA1 family n=1 Tax=Flavobacterium fluvii TaxID=468056 RepID=A0A1M5DZL0_9FLAO|nr:polysaccharide deacetylase family protein [Flavobacterium fluvii]SHF72271.1 Peptidoglycan/xylan/chitin deacetylase, PgdA/CDA1 family [Flavobacterium fluvii]
MSFYWIKTNSLIKTIFSNYVWDVPNTENKIYLTFDDGPTPEITQWVLEELQKYNAKATFFCIGKNIEKHPEIFEKVINNGHSIGNHTFNHLNGWKTSTEEYLENVKLCESSISNLKSKICTLKSALFRPPYGKIKSSQSKKLRQLGYKIIMWDVLSADYDTTITPEKCLENVLKNINSGSIIVFHDSVKAFPNLKYTLPKALEYCAAKGFVFEKLD